MCGKKNPIARSVCSVRWGLLCNRLLQVRQQVVVQTLRTADFLELYRALEEAGVTALVVKGIFDIIKEINRQGVTILGVEGSMSGTEDMDIEPAKSVTPKTTAQTILPAEGYDGMAQVTVEAIPVTRTDNAQGGVTVTIAAA